MPTLSLSRYQINEWRLFSYSTSVSSTVNPAGFTLTQVGVKFNLVREYQHYLTKIVTPLSVLAINAHLIHFLPVTSLTDRMANTFTMFLAAFALLYVVGDTVPPLDCLTNIDRIIFHTLLVLSWLGLESAIVYHLDEHGYAQAVWLDHALAGVSIVYSLLGFLLLVLRAVRRQSSAVRCIQQQQQCEQQQEHASAQLEGRESAMASEVIDLFKRRQTLNSARQNAPSRPWRLPAKPKIEQTA